VTATIGVVGLADRAEVLAGDVGGLGAGLAAAGVVDDQHALVVGRGRRVVQQQLHAPPVDLPGVPGCLREEPLQALHGLVLGADDRLGAGQRGEGLVAAAGQQQAREVGAEAAALRQRGEQGVELGGVVLKRAGCGWAGQAVGHRDHLSCETRRRPLLLHKPA